ncbi:hypothetical protein ACLMJK_001981 [Lecanora helva]
MLSGQERTEITKLGVIDPELEELLKHLKPPSYDYSKPTEVIQNMRTYMEQWYIPPEPNSNVSEDSIFLPVRDNHQLRALIFKATEPPTKPRPLIVFYHGGGYTMGRPEDAAVLCRLLVQKFDAVCIAPTYRLAPEHQFPTGVNDGWDGFKWIASSADSLGADPMAGFLLGGVSAGGNLASVFSHRARDEAIQPPLTGVFLQTPGILPPTVVPEKYRDRYLSRTQPECLKDPILTPELKKLYYDAYAPDDYSALSVPFNWPTGHRDLPPHFLQVCGSDINRDENLIFESVLREENGVMTRMDIYPGQPHIFWQVFRELSATKKFWADTVSGIAWLLQKEKRVES